MVGPQPLFRVFRIRATGGGFPRGEAIGSNALMTWDSAWDYSFNLSQKGYTTWVEPA
ncbi:hypothetical protein LCGC14_2531830 [marine sediment metagenome]|uniref:Uncharacterized protein n=1 Tax=marine sediment metagenome TaxID=412755 RepID=A0A0F9BG64_9ZZZZ